MKGKHWLAPSGGVTCAVAATLAPKCPACLGAYLSFFGVGLGTAGVVSVLRPTLLALSVAILGAWCVSTWLRRRRFGERSCD